MTLTTEEIRDHYLRDEVKEVLLKATEIQGHRQALITGFAGWYRYKNKDGKTKMALTPFREKHYEKQIKKNMGEETRSLYWSTNFFDNSVFDEWIDKEEWEKDKASKPGGYGTTGFYRLGIDVDLLDKKDLEELEEDRNIMNADSREKIEQSLQFIIEWFEDRGLKRAALRTYFSGNGGYLTVSPEVAKLGCDPEKAFKICEGFNALTKQIEKEFYQEVEDADKYVKFDALNNASRAWKTILSIHKDKPLACIPLSTTDLEIDILKAKPPLEKEIIEEAKAWIEPTEDPEKHTEALGELLNSEVIDRELFEDKLNKWGETQEEKVTPLDVAEAKLKKRATYETEEGEPKRNYESLNVDISDLEDLKDILPPCLGSLIKEKTALSHARGKAILARLLDVVGLDHEEAKKIYDKLTQAAGGPTSNIFPSWYARDMCLPGCEKIKAVGSGYPSLEVGDLSLCDPNELCEKVENPFNYIKEKTEPEPIKTGGDEEEEEIKNPFKNQVPEFGKVENPRQKIFDILEKDIKKDKETTEAVLLVGLSAYSSEPQNIFLRGPSSAGKSHTIVNTLEYLPDEDTVFLGDLSPKALVHQKGRLIDENGEPLGPKPNEDAPEEEIEEWKARAENAKNLIDLQNQILIFLEAPSKKTFEMLRPILSHDVWEHEYKFAESSSAGIYTNTVVIRGWPSTIFATTDVDFLEDLVTRSLTITPEMSTEKYEAANELTANKFAIPIDNPEEEKKKKQLKNYLRSVKKVAGTCKAAIPFAQALVEPYPSKSPQDMRDFKKFLALIRMETLQHAFKRPIVNVGKNWLLLSIKEDLANALKPFKKSFVTTQTGVSQEIIDIYKDVFKPEEGTRPGYETLIDNYKEERGEPISREWLKTKVINPLEKLGWVDVEPDPDDKRKKQFRIQGEIKTFENLCRDIEGAITKEKLKEWVNQVTKIPRLKQKMCYSDFYKSLNDPKEVEEDRLMRIIGVNRGKLETPKHPSNNKQEEEKNEKTKQRFSKVNSQEEIFEKIVIFYEEYGDPEWTISDFLDPLTEHFKENTETDLDREELRSFVERLVEERKITLTPDLEDVEKPGGGG